MSSEPMTHEAIASETGGKTGILPGFAQKTGVFYGWVIAIVSGLGLAAGISVFLPATIGLLIAPLAKDFGWSPPQVIFALTCNTLATLVFAPLTGRVVDRIGPKRVAILSLIAQAALIASFYFLTASLIQLYILYGLFAAFGTGTTAVTYSALISRWFDRHRGLGLGIALAGVGMGGTLWSLLISHLFESIGWRQTMLAVAIGLIAIVLPILLLALRDRPEAMGLAPDGDDPASHQARLAVTAEKTGMTLRESIVMPRFWLVLAAFFLITAGAYGVLLNLVTILTGQGVGRATASSAQGAFYLAVVLGRFVTGWLMDRFFAPRVAIALLVPGIVGTVMLAAGVSTTGAFIAAFCVGIAAGAEIDVLAYVIGRYFGLKHFGSIYSLHFAAVALATSVGPYVAAQLAVAAGGNYTSALIMLTVVFVVAGVLLLCFPRFPVSRSNNR